MKTSGLLALGIISLLLSPSLKGITTDTWNGGSVTSNDLDEDANWVDHSAPASDFWNTEVVFAGTSRLTPHLAQPFSAQTVKFSVGAGAFVIDGEKLQVFEIKNFSSQTMTFTNAVSFGQLTLATVDAAAGGLVFTKAVNLPFGRLTVMGSGSTAFSGFIETHSINELVKEGSGTMTWAPGVAVNFPVSIAGGTLTLPADGATDVFTDYLGVTGTSVLNMNESVTLDSALLIRDSGAQINLALGKTLTVRAGSDVEIGGAFATSVISQILVTGGGSTFTTTGAFTLGGGASANVNLAADMSTGSGAINIGTAGNGFFTLSDSSTLSGGNLQVGLSGATGTLTFNSESEGTFAGISVDASSVPGTNGTLVIQGESFVTGTSLNIATNAFSNQGTVTISGAGSVLSLSGAAAATANIGAPALSTGTLNVNSGSFFSSGTGLTSVNPTGKIAIDGGNYISHGTLRIDGGKLTRDDTGTLSLDAGTTMLVQSGGDANMDGAFANNTTATIIVTGTGSTFTVHDDLSINGGSTLALQLGGQVTSTVGAARIGTTGNGGVVTVDGASSKLTSAGAIIGEGGHFGSLTFRNGSSGKLSNITVDNSGLAGTSGLLQIQTGATVTGTSLTVAAGSNANLGTVTINGLNSALTLTGAATTTLGAASGTTGSLNVQSLGTFNSGTGLTSVNPTGTIAITDGTFNANGDLTLNGGQLTRDAAGLFSLDAARTFRVQAGGDALFTGAFSNTTASAIVVTGAGSTLSTTGLLGIQSGSTLTIGLGGAVSAGGGNVSIGTAGGTGTATVAGAGSIFSGNVLNVGLNGFGGSLNFLSGSSGGFGVIQVSASSVAGTSGALSIQTGAKVTGTSLAVGSLAAATNGNIAIGGAGSALTLTGGVNSTIGAASGSTGTLTVQSGGTFTTGTGAVNVNATGALNINNGGTLLGPADFNGTGPINIAGAYKPGAVSGVDQTTSVSFAQNMTFQPTTSITMELGGVTAGGGHDQLVFNGPGATQVTWNGLLNVVFINGFLPQAGHSFDLFNFDPARDAGAFTAINLPLLPPGMFWRAGQIYLDGTIRISVTPNTYSEWETVFGVTGGFDGDDDGDGIKNGIEFLLGSNPKLPFVGGGLQLTELMPTNSAVDATAHLTVDIPADPASDAFYRITASNDLVNWTTIASKDGAGPWSGAAAVTAETPVNGFTRLNIAESLPLGSAKRFHRLEAVSPLPF